jgi:hypothetical protein
VENALVIPEKFEHLPGFRVYSVYLLTGSTYDKEAVANICKAAFFLLNKARNLGELFLHPRALVVKEYYLSGTIGIKNDTLQYTLLRQMQDRINNYIFPRVAPVGYDTVQATDTSVNEILNGPLLTNGYILAGTPGSKKNLLNVIDLPALLLAIPGMVSARGLSFFASYGDNPSSPPEPVTNISEISCLPGEMLVINLYASRTGMPHTNEQLKITVAGNEIPFNPQNVLPPVPSGTPGIPVSFVYGKSAGALDRLPSGIYRDINSYYSVQNTFPAIYGAGPQGTDAGASAFEKARVKQLKGYLTLIDQVLANQFSQLANVPVLFSFKNAAVGAPSDLRTLLETKDQFQKETLPYPVPYRVFSPTYFYQSLYEVPYIRPLLKNNDAYNFHYSSSPKDEAEYKSWMAYREDPYNGYMRGLMQLMRSDDPNLSRRNTMLDHLLARHGESPLLINALISGSVYAGNTEQDLVIFKSLYLQNLWQLAYNRQKGYNYPAADKLTLPGFSLPASAFDDTCLCLIEKKEQDNATDYDEDTIDFIFHSERINKLEKISSTDFINYSAAELKLFLLFGLRVQYSIFIRQYFKELEANVTAGPPVALQATDPAVIQAGWLLQQRRGMLMIETSLLLYAGYDLIIAADKEEGQWYFVTDLLLSEAFMLGKLLQDEDREMIKIQLDKKYIVYNGANYPLMAAKADTIDGITWLPETGNGYSFGIPYVPAEGAQPVLDPDTLLFILPSFIDLFVTSAFATRMELFFENELPAGIKGQYYTVSSYILGPLIAAFVDWHNSLRNPCIIDHSGQRNPCIIDPPGRRRALANELISQLSSLIESPIHGNL